MNDQSSYYSVSYSTTALKICPDTEHEKVGKQHILQKCSIFISFVVTHDLLIAELSK